LKPAHYRIYADNLELRVRPEFRYTWKKNAYFKKEVVCSELELLRETRQLSAHQFCSEKKKNTSPSTFPHNYDLLSQRIPEHWRRRIAWQLWPEGPVGSAPLGPEEHRSIRR